MGIKLQNLNDRINFVHTLAMEAMIVQDEKKEEISFGLEAALLPKEEIDVPVEGDDPEVDDDLDPKDSEAVEGDGVDDDLEEDPDLGEDNDDLSFEYDLLSAEESYMATEGILFSSKKGRNKVLDNINTIKSGLEKNLTGIEKALTASEKVVPKVLSGNFTYADIEPYLNEMKDIVDGLSSEKEVKKYIKAYKKGKKQRILNRADMKSEEVDNANKEAYALFDSYMPKFSSCNDRYVKMVTEWNNKIPRVIQDTQINSVGIYINWLAHQLNSLGYEITQAKKITKSKNKPAKECLTAIEDLKNDYRDAMESSFDPETFVLQYAAMEGIFDKFYSKNTTAMYYPKNVSSTKATEVILGLGKPKDIPADGEKVQLTVFGKKYSFECQKEYYEKVTGNQVLEERLNKFFNKFMREHKRIFTKKGKKVVNYLNSIADEVKIDRIKKIAQVEFKAPYRMYITYNEYEDEFSIGISMSYDWDSEHGFGMLVYENGDSGFGQGSYAFAGPGKSERSEASYESIVGFFDKSKIKSTNVKLPENTVADLEKLMGKFTKGAKEFINKYNGYIEFKDETNICINPNNCIKLPDSEKYVVEIMENPKIEEVIYIDNIGNVYKQNASEISDAKMNIKKFIKSTMKSKGVKVQPIQATEGLTARAYLANKGFSTPEIEGILTPGLYSPESIISKLKEKYTAKKKAKAEKKFMKKDKIEQYQKFCNETMPKKKQEVQSLINKARKIPVPKELSGSEFLGDIVEVDNDSIDIMLLDVSDADTCSDDAHEKAFAEYCKKIEAIKPDNMEIHYDENIIAFYYEFGNEFTYAPSNQKATESYDEFDEDDIDELELDEMTDEEIAFIEGVDDDL